MAPILTGAAMANAGTPDGTNSLVYPHTVGSGNNQVLYVAFCAGISRVMTSATFNGVAMDKVLSYSAGSRIVIDIYRLINPPVGTYNVSFSWILKMEVSAISLSYKDVEVTLPNGAAVTASGSGSGSHPSVTISSGVTSTCIDFVMAARDTVGITISADGAGQTRYGDVGGTSIDGWMEHNVATEEAGAGSVTMTHTLSVTGSDTAWASVGYSLNPKSAVTQNGFFF